ncbi:transcription factor PAP1 [Colletotrichum graminicola M1.001]|uniref:Transcription factor PAP1 n=1 Tax=Colletotrichum graminicola (strain M1.001 / M2 / FGSC 10212) TaxID=645133 RepID=E3QH82_COLGM|nr:transcription factor PAP1 [Colletotrichum graminicola M1.001]EFQ30244.1 transcription factor PAP1 [Colletotrichum graminicola M1.001]
MASATNSGFPTNFILTPQQQSLLFAALNSNKQQLANQSPATTTKDTSMSPSSYQTSPAQGAAHGFQESPYLDNYDYDFGDSSFDFDVSTVGQGKMIGDIPGGAQSAQSTKSDSTENDGTDKRAHPDDEEDEDSPGNGAKRREGSEKVPKKPGRKPLTSEPSSKRKAQNRAAQRAFRERKEKHLKDLETKVEELEKASKDANSENSQLRAQIERMTAELNEYKTKMAAMSTRSVPHTKSPMGFGASAIGNLSDVNFQFEFPKFGVLPGSQMPNKPAQSTRSSSSPNANESNPVSPLDKNNSSGAFAGLDFGTKDDLTNFTSLFSPSLATGSTGTGTSRTSVDSGLYGINNGTSTSSPSASSQSNGGGPSSSCGTSPEPFTQSPMGFKPVDTMTTIGEESANQQSLFAGIDTGNFDWLAQQNGGQFDPQLFGDYREPQDNVLAGTTFDDSFFNDAIDADFITPYNMALSPAVPKKNLIDQIDAAKNADDDLIKEAVKADNYNCNKIWEKLQSCPSVQAGEFDLDNLCSELQKKAKCSGQGPVVSETDFQTVVNKWMGKDAAACFNGQEKNKTKA